ncbi:sigma-70 family RNA polymerase sigma factor (plasmid) [Nocardia sp. NBC_01503]|uniref:RNA polymerase sigma factor n=1 Tax=Nocardia sp. NBC_01503 TaxID=2975997 RepID=UPI002E7B9508|nr:sigma-70 family RNA polymerase sigma factor [Nocardia sp. NBC_01503]WTL36667.1 sigma-70 family RNA polymerase sigma factor [Nocardia sp. NBC_01503]WTL36780.1 sigma-70 family RNA polymerase sigma factor [Nocardia sp. NBC_01503]
MSNPELLDPLEPHDIPGASQARRSFENESREADLARRRYDWFDTFYATHNPLIVRLSWFWHGAFRFLNPQDVAQQAWTKLLTAPTLDPERHEVSTFVAVVVRHVAYDLARQYRNQQQRDQPLDRQDEQIMSTITVDAGTGEEIDLLDPVRRICARAGLSDKHGEVLLLVHGLDLSNAQVAEQLGTSENNVRQMKSRAERAIRQATGLTPQELRAVKLFRRHFPQPGRQGPLETIATEMKISVSQCRCLLGDARSKITAFLTHGDEN